jgi:hypothetical protein
MPKRKPRNDEAKKKPPQGKPPETPPDTDTTGKPAPQAKPTSADDHIHATSQRSSSNVVYKKTIHIGKHTQRQFETALSKILNADQRLLAWQAYAQGGSVTLVIKP